MLVLCKKSFLVTLFVLMKPRPLKSTRSDTLLPYTTPFRSQLELSLLLGPRRLLHRADAQPPRCARRAREVSRLSAQHRRPCGGRADPAALFGDGRHRTRRERRRKPRRLSRHGSGAQGHCRLDAGAARRLWPDRAADGAGLFRPAPFPPARRAPLRKPTNPPR